MRAGLRRGGATRNIAGSPVEGTNFFGREAASRSFWEDLQHHDVLPLGPRRIGKTSLARRVRLRDVLLRDAYWSPDEAGGSRRYRFNLEALRQWWLRRTTLATAVAAENLGAARSGLEQLFGDRETALELWASAALEELIAQALRAGHGATILRLLREVGLEQMALPLALALEAAVAGGRDGLANVEPEARAAAEALFERLTAGP